MGVRLTWNGNAITERVMNAAQEAIDETTEEAAKDAAGSHWWANRSGSLDANVISEPARRDGSSVSGRFGSTQTQGFYGLFHERRTPFLRPAADRVFSTLARRIASRLR